MVGVQLTGGLGNQLFQYAAAKALSLHHKTELLLEVSSFYRAELPDLEVPRNFELYNFAGVEEKLIKAAEHQTNKAFSFLKERRIEKILPNYKRNIYKEPFYHFDENFWKSKPSVFLKGGWQSPQYFSAFDALIKSSLVLKDEMMGNVKQKAASLQNQNTVAVHIRRADYLRKPIILEWHGVLGKEHYAKAFEEINNYTQIEKVLYFSDDPEWVEKELLPMMPGEIVSNATSSNQYEDFYLMQHCTHNIIANSSFSWWAAYLNPNPNKIVIAPQRWFNKAPLNTKDLYPNGWLKL
jgi:Glycosyl transferase family 11